MDSSVHFSMTAKRPAEFAMDIQVEDEVPSQRCLQPVGGLSSTNWCLLGASWCEVLPALRWNVPVRAPTRSCTVLPPVRPGYDGIYQARGRVGGRVSLHVGAPQSSCTCPLLHTNTRVSVLHVLLPFLSHPAI